MPARSPLVTKVRFDEIDEFLEHVRTHADAIKPRTLRTALHVRHRAFVPGAVVIASVIVSRTVVELVHLHSPPPAERDGDFELMAGVQPMLAGLRNAAAELGLDVRRGVYDRHSLTPLDLNLPASGRLPINQATAPPPALEGGAITVYFEDLDEFLAECREHIDRSTRKTLRFQLRRRDYLPATQVFATATVVVGEIVLHLEHLVAECVAKELMNNGVLTRAGTVLAELERAAVEMGFAICRGSATLKPKLAAAAETIPVHVD